MKRHRILLIVHNPETGLATAECNCGDHYNGPSSNVEVWWYVH